MMFDPGSFRDPSGRVLMRDSRVLRAVFEHGRAAFEAADSAGVLRRAIDKGLLLDMQPVDPAVVAGIVPTPVHVIEHPRLDFVSYPYEWTFSALKAAALHHLDFQLDLLEQGFTLSDATAYNVQFNGPRPVFIDHLSVIPYVEGSLWTGQRQFGMQFLNPLVLWAKRGIAPNAWFRGSLEGIAPEDLAPLLRTRDKLSFTVMAHIVAQARLQRAVVNAGFENKPKAAAKLSKTAFKAILVGLKDYIAGLTLPDTKSVWSDYAAHNSYDDTRRSAKHDFVAKLVREEAPGLFFDVGCNSGDFSATALDAGAKSVVGFDFDFGALERAFARFTKSGQKMLPLWLDAANPSPAQGWASAERKSFGERAKGDSMVALALIHHIAISRNVPLDQAVDWLMAMAPTGIIEFPNKDDVMVRELLSNRPDIFPDYTEEAFVAHVSARGRIVEQTRLGDSTRLLVRYDSRT